MSEIYWLTRLGELCNFIAIIAILAGFVAAFIGITMCFENCDAVDEEDYEKVRKLWKWFKWAVIACLLLALTAILLPSKKDMLLIYGVGGTIDYIKENPTAQKLPDKAIEALDKYLDEANKDKE